MPSERRDSYVTFQALYSAAVHTRSVSLPLSHKTPTNVFIIIFSKESSNSDFYLNHIKVQVP